MEKAKLLFKEYYDELLYKVTWPKFEELQSNTVTVLIACLLIAIIVALVDIVAKFSIQTIYDLFN
jgi:preprotein translocase subunit SecE